MFSKNKTFPFSSTVNPDFKREHIRSVVVGLSRPLPLPQEFLNSTPKHTSTTTLGFDDEHDIDKNLSVVPLIVTNDSNYALRLSQNTYNSEFCKFNKKTSGKNQKKTDFTETSYPRI